MFNGPETRERLEKEFECMQSLMLAGGFKCATGSVLSVANVGENRAESGGGYHLNGELLEDAYRSDFMKRDEFQKRFVSSLITSKCYSNRLQNSLFPLQTGSTIQ